jgi:hypothetical protein
MNALSFIANSHSNQNDTKPKKKESRWISRDSAFCDEIYQLGEFVFQKMKKTPQKL